MFSKELFALVGLAVVITGCCCATSDLEGPSAFCTGPTFAQSCEKSCNSVASGTDYYECVQECKDVLTYDGIDPNSCCPREYTIRGLCEMECSYTSYPGPGTCVENCGQMYQEMGLGLDDCISAA